MAPAEFEQVEQGLISDGEATPRHGRGFLGLASALTLGALVLAGMFALGVFSGEAQIKRSPWVVRELTEYKTSKECDEAEGAAVDHMLKTCMDKGFGSDECKEAEKAIAPADGSDECQGGQKMCTITETEDTNEKEEHTFKQCYQPACSAKDIVKKWVNRNNRGKGICTKPG